MATRFYLGKSSFTAIDPGVLGTWGYSYRQRYKMGTTDLNTAFSTYSVSGMSTSATTLMRQFITAPLQAGTLLSGTDTWTFTMRFKESSTALNIVPRIYMSVVSETGTPRGYAFTALGTEFSTSLTARQIVVTGLVGSYTLQDGDRLVLEVGWDKQASTTGTGYIEIGDADAADLSGDGDTGQNNPWFEYSGTMTLDSESVDPTEGDNYSLTSYISGVLDEWV